MDRPVRNCTERVIEGHEKYQDKNGVWIGRVLVYTGPDEEIPVPKNSVLGLFTETEPGMVTGEIWDDTEYEPVKPGKLPKHTR